MIDHPSERMLVAYLDGDLEPSQRWDLTAHVESCAECQATVEGFGALADVLGELPSSLKPPVDLWPEIRARLGTLDGPRQIVAIPVAPALRRSTPRLGGLVAAIAAVLLLGVAIGRQLPRLPASSSIAAVEALPPVLASYDTPGYEAAVSDLEAVLEQLRPDLQPATIAVVEENLAIIDGAIEEARAAILADPANEQLHRYLATHMQQKLKMLRMVTVSMTAAT